MIGRTPGLRQAGLRKAGSSDSGGGGGTPFVASGAGHAAGLVVDPPAVAGTTKFLREDATWAVPGSALPVRATVLTEIPIEFTGLTGDAADVFGYELHYRFKYSGSVPLVLLTFNGDVTPANYADSYQGTAMGAPLTDLVNANNNAGITVNPSAAGTGIVSGRINVLFPASGDRRQVLFASGGQENSNAYPSLRRGYGYWLNTANEITTMELRCGTSGGVFVSATATLETLRAA